MDAHANVTSFRQIDKTQWRRMLFYVDLLVMLTFVVSNIFLVVHAYRAGMHFQAGDFVASNQHMWRVATDTAFVVGSLTWIFFRFFKNQYVAMQRPF